MEKPTRWVRIPFTHGRKSQKHYMQEEIRSVITTSQRLSRSGKPIFIAGADVTERIEWTNEQVKPMFDGKERHSQPFAKHQFSLCIGTRRSSWDGVQNFYCVAITVLEHPQLDLDCPKPVSESCLVQVGRRNCGWRLALHMQCDSA